jgi:glucokinase
VPQLAIGVDLGGTNARAAVVNRDSGEIVAAHKEPHRERSLQAVIETVAYAVRQSAAAAAIPPGALGHVGVGVAGQVLGKTGVVLNAPNLGWRNVPLGEELERALQARVRIANDLSAAAWGERRFGAARGVDDAALVFVGSGVGSGLILGGRLHEGHHGVAGELGHVKVRPMRPGTPVRRCGCGELSCLEAYASGVNIAARVREELERGAATAVRDLMQGDLERVNASIVDRAHAQGDPYALALWEEVAELLGTAIAALVTLLNPARIILGGGVILACPELYRLSREVFAAKVSRSAAVGLSVERAFLGDDAGVIGAALLE